MAGVAARPAALPRSSVKIAAGGQSGSSSRLAFCLFLPRLLLPAVAPANARAPSNASSPPWSQLSGRHARRVISTPSQTCLRRLLRLTSRSKVSSPSTSPFFLRPPRFSWSVYFTDTSRTAQDHTGVTPLIEAVKNGHVEIVRLLLDKGVYRIGSILPHICAVSQTWGSPTGAEPTNASSQGPPESYTSDPVVLGLLSAARSKMAQGPAMQPDGAYAQEQPVNASNVDPATAGYYPPPPGAYYYPPMPVPPPVLPDGTVPYYAPPPHMPTDQNPAGLGNLPPPEVARMIPCRYYPACRYGSSCMFAHPQGPYMQGPLPPPVQYPGPYDPMSPGPYPPPTYYPVPPGTYAPSPNGAPVNHMSPPNLIWHGP